MTTDIHQLHNVYAGNRDANGVVNNDSLQDIKDTMGLEAYSVVAAWSRKAEKRASYHPGKPAIAADSPAKQKSGGTKITLGEAKEKEGDDKKAEGKEGEKVAAEKKPEEPDFFARLTDNPLTQELLGDAMNFEIPTEIARLDIPPTPTFGTAFQPKSGNRTSPEGNDFFAQFNKKPSSRLA